MTLASHHHSSRQRQFVLRALTALGLWPFLALYAALVLGIVPRTLLGWALFLTVGPVLALVGEVTVEGLARRVGSFPPIRQTADWLERRTAGRTVSVLRVCFLLVILLSSIVILGGAVIFIAGLARQWPPLDRAFLAAEHFLARHFWP